MKKHPWMLLLAGCCCGGVQTSTAAPTPGIDGCVMPLVANCLNGDAGLVACEKDSDQRCGTTSSAQIWAGVEQAEILQGFVPKGH